MSRKIKWIQLEVDPTKVSTEKLEKVINHNNTWIEMQVRLDHNLSEHTESRWYDSLNPYAIELERRKKVKK